MDGDVDGLSGLEGPANTNSSHSVSGSKPCTDISSRTEFSDTLSDQFELLDLPKDVDVLALDEEGKVAELKVMFPLLKDMDVRFALRKAGGDFTKACEELLSTQFLEENGLRPKGIDGAFRDDNHVGHRKGKKILIAAKLTMAFFVIVWLTVYSLLVHILVYLSGHSADFMQVVPERKRPRTRPVRPGSRSSTASSLWTSTQKTRQPAAPSRRPSALLALSPVGARSHG